MTYNPHITFVPLHIDPPWEEDQAKSRLEPGRPVPVLEYRTCASAITPPGWYCSRTLGHGGPCAAHQETSRYANALEGICKWGMRFAILMLGVMLIAGYALLTGELS